VAGVVGAVIPVLFGFARDGVPAPMTIAGIGMALVAVVLVTRAPGRDTERPSGLGWGLLAGLAFGGFNICVGGLSTGAFAPLVVIRLLQTTVLLVLIVAWRQPWRVARTDIGRLAVVGLLDMSGNVAFIAAAQAGALAVAAVLSSLYPVVTVMLAIAILRDRLSRSHLTGVALTAVAIVLIGAGNATL
jgi:drug/metabolite transporter (DMT)-like permease